ncbi:phosphopantetheine-binding protein [Micromonospora sp. CPCC 206061]|uniref:phosphopantetheine-binding protein n=1 Tax=Micromonospora sp. CPCC 206061 TaxID=3122410 RepID=UPI002FF04FD3
MSSTTAGQPPTIDVLRAAVAEILGTAPDAVPDDANLVRLGLDSLGMLRLANRVRRAGIRVSFKGMATEPTLAAWARHLDRVAGQPAPGSTVRRAAGATE